MIYKFFVTISGVPSATPDPATNIAWLSLRALDGTDKSTNAPTISRVTGATGWYKFEVTYGTDPFDVPELVGVIDLDNTEALGISASERYVPVNISLRDLALTMQINKADFNTSNGTLKVYKDDSTTEIEIKETTTGTTTTREIQIS